MKSSRLFAVLQLVLWLLGLVAAIAFLNGLGDGRLALPDSTTNAWNEWLKSTDPTTIVFALARVATLVALYYLLTAIVFSCLAYATEFKILTRIANAIALPVVQSVAKRAIAISFVGALSVPGAASAEVTTSNVPTLHHLLPGENNPLPSTATTTTSAVVTPPPVATAPTTAASIPVPDAVQSTWTVQRGDNLWRIAETTLTQNLDHQPSDDEVISYWQEVVNTNRGQLVDPDNPNLIQPGQIMILPPISHP